jgi:hypothetical protein
MNGKIIFYIAFRYLLLSNFLFMFSFWGRKYEFDTIFQDFYVIFSQVVEMVRWEQLLLRVTVKMRRSFSNHQKKVSKLLQANALVFDSSTTNDYFVQKVKVLYLHLVITLNCWLFSLNSFITHCLTNFFFSARRLNGTGTGASKAQPSERFGLMSNGDLNQLNT